MASSTERNTATILHAQAFTRHPRLTMQTPTTSQLRTAIEVLKKLEERIDTHATHNVPMAVETRSDATIPVYLHGFNCHFAC